MKNIHLLPTDKPSRLCLSNNNILTIIAESNYNFSHIKSVHIYITSDEEIKEGDWFYCFQNNNVLKCFKKEEKVLNGYHTVYKKIILTTDQDLIKDGVQSIDDTFLEWFVKNPSCEKVEIEIKPMFPMYSTFIESIDNPPFYGNLKREIIIPKEQTNGERFEEFMKTVEGYPELEGTMNLCEDIIEKKTGKMTEEEWQAAERAQIVPKQENCCTPIGQIKRYVDCIGCDIKPNQETIEEADSKWSLEEAQKFALSKFKKENSPGVVTWKSVLDVLTVGVLTGHKFGAKWQEERMYSEEDLREAFKQSRQALIFEKDMPPVYESFEEWFEQFKKK